MWNQPAVVPGHGWWSGAAASHAGLAAAVQPLLWYKMLRR